MKRLASLSILIILIGCMNSNDSIEESPAKQYLEQKGFQVVSYEGNTGSYELTSSKLFTLPYFQIWAVQSVDPSEYFGKTIEVENFIVKNHPLARGKVDVSVLLVDGEPIGGTSFPNGGQLVGSVYSVDGKTLEEVHSLTLEQFREKWEKEYK